MNSEAVLGLAKYEIACREHKGGAAGSRHGTRDDGRAAAWRGPKLKAGKEAD